MPLIDKYSSFLLCLNIYLLYSFKAPVSPFKPKKYKSISESMHGGAEWYDMIIEF